jgi:hypothetical protein
VHSAHIVALIGALYPGSSEQQVLSRLQYLFHSGHLSRPKAQVLVSPKLFLVADRPGLARAEDFSITHGSTPPASSTGYSIRSCTRCGH